MTNISRQTVTRLCLVITVIAVWNPNSHLWGLCPLLEGVGRCPPQLEQLRTFPLSALKPNPLKQGANQLCWDFTRAQDLAVPKLSALQKHTHMHATRSMPTAKQQGRRPSKLRAQVQAWTKYAGETSLRTHQDLAKQRKQTLPPTNCCFNRCRPWWLPLPDPKQLLAPAAILASTPLWPSRICNSSFKTAFTATNCAANVRLCQTTL